MSDLDAWDHDPHGPGREDVGQSLSSRHAMLMYAVEEALVEALSVLGEIVACDEVGWGLSDDARWEVDRSKTPRLAEALDRAKALTAKFPEETP